MRRMDLASPPGGSHVYIWRDVREGDPLDNNEQQRASEQCVISALFCDVVGSTAPTETLDPEDWADIVNEAVTEMAVCIERYGGTVAQVAGRGWCAAVQLCSPSRVALMWSLSPQIISRYTQPQYR